jgi:hypothetical protein
MNNSINPISNNEIEIMKYNIYYYYEQLRRAYECNKNEFQFLYYMCLEYFIYSYGKYNGIKLPLKTKIFQYIFDEEYYLNKDLKKISDNNFLEMVKRCMKNDKDEIMYRNITELKDYLLKFIGGFNIDGWKIRFEIQ